MKVEIMGPCAVLTEQWIRSGPSPIKAGFPSPAENYLEAQLDLNRELIRHPSATFFVRVEGDSMEGAGIHHGAILIVDRAREAQHNDIIVAVLEGNFTVKQLILSDTTPTLRAAHPAYEDIHLNSYPDFQVWGVVTSAIHRFVE